MTIIIHDSDILINPSLSITKIWNCSTISSIIFSTFFFIFTDLLFYFFYLFQSIQSYFLYLQSHYQWTKFFVKNSSDKEKLFRLDHFFNDAHQYVLIDESTIFEYLLSLVILIKEFLLWLNLCLVLNKGCILYSLLRIMTVLVLSSSILLI